MTDELAPLRPGRELARAGFEHLPAIIARAGEKAGWRFIEFFTANIRNKNTRAAYAHAVTEFFRWCEKREIWDLAQLNPVIISAYIENHTGAAPTVKQHLAALRMLFDYLILGQVIPMNPASAVRGPKHVVKKGKTPILTADQARTFLDSIETDTIIGLRDRAVIGIMVYSFARVSATIHMRVEDYYQNGKRWWFRLHEKGGKRHEVPAHHNAEAYVDAYMDTAGLWDEKKSPLFRTIDHGKLTVNAMTRIDVWKMIKRRALAASVPYSTCCHSWRGTGITEYLSNGGILEKAQAIANHESAKTTKLYDRRSDEISLDEIERITI